MSSVIHEPRCRTANGRLPERRRHARAAGRHRPGARVAPDGRYPGAVDSQAPGSARTRRDPRAVVASVLVRFVALVVLVAAVAKFADVGLPPESRLHYEPWTMAAIGTVEFALAGWALWRPRRLPALLLVAFLVTVTVYLLLIPPGELERVGCSCFGSRFRFQDVRTHIRLNGVLILMAVAGAWWSGRAASRR